MTIDHEERRRRIAAVAIDVIAEEGLDAATIRRIAAELQLSTTAITYFFADKRALLLWTYRVLAEEGDERFEEAIAREPVDLVEVLLTMVPWQPRNVRRWRGYLAFWDEGARDPVLGEEIRRSTQVGFDSITRALRAAYPGLADPERASRLLNAVIQGFSLQTIVGARTLSVEEARAFLQEAIDMVLDAKARPE